jgi:hypothetical protein
MPHEEYNLDLENQRTQLQGDAISFIRNLLYKRKDKSIIPDGEDYNAVLIISSDIAERNDKLEYFLEKYNYIYNILTKLLLDGDTERVASVNSMLKIMTKLRERISQLIKEEFELLSNSGGRRGKKTYKKRVRSRKTHKKRVMSRKFRMRRSNRVTSRF